MSRNVIKYIKYSGDGEALKKAIAVDDSFETVDIETAELIESVTGKNLNPEPEAGVNALNNSDFLRDRLPGLSFLSGKAVAGKFLRCYNKAEKDGEVMKVRRHYIIRGFVQGVGFRYRACHAAAHFGVTGWVKNSSDGSVEMEAEGEREDIRSMFEAIERGMFIEIEDIEEEELPIENDRSFEVKE